MSILNLKQNKRIWGKTVYITVFHRGSHRVYAGTVEYLVNKVFGYTLECGHSWNERIKENPKTASSLVKSLNLSAAELNHYSDIYYVSTSDEIAAYNAKCNENLCGILIS